MPGYVNPSSSVRLSLVTGISAFMTRISKSPAGCQCGRSNTFEYYLPFIQCCRRVGNRCLFFISSSSSSHIPVNVVRQSVMPEMRLTRPKELSILSPQSFKFMVKLQCLEGKTKHGPEAPQRLHRGSQGQCAYSHWTEKRGGGEKVRQ